MTLVASIDPGACPAYALLDPAQVIPRRYFPPAPLVLAVSLRRPDWIVRAQVVGTELQWLHGPQNKRAVLTLSFSAGWQLARACAHGAVPCAMPVQRHGRTGTPGWRDVLGIAPGVLKEVACRRCAQSLTPAERALVLSSGVSPKRLLDVYDSIMIGWATCLAPTQYKEPP